MADALTLTFGIVTRRYFDMMIQPRLCNAALSAGRDESAGFWRHCGKEKKIATGVRLVDLRGDRCNKSLAVEGFPTADKTRVSEKKVFETLRAVETGDVNHELQ